MHGVAFQGFRLRGAEFARREGADTAGDKYRAGRKLGAGAGQHAKTVIGFLQLGHLFAEMEARFERRNLLQQPVSELLAGAHRHRRDIVDRLVRIQLGALAAGVSEAVDDVGLEAEQAQLEYLEQPAGAGAHDQGICLDGHVGIPAPVAASAVGLR